jgi:hypothetical protein
VIEYAAGVNDALAGFWKDSTFASGKEPVKPPKTPMLMAFFTILGKFSLGHSLSNPSR